ncbi:oligosaccharide flippase family protein [Methanolobus chelungpuianus]|uniref:Polysaccharide biosynthesis protein C-terminal domain-containing protein n=1 Tax=Methanolobus chelungpuianus TaxID=502115 RepID=A0AAE3KXW6_9EURY|nr:oligosaccharide flippase family protein [Methanolobus chelungpuianus]MCQ6963410.1 hypothetical protein [Methanolobus chelungpuianus]
MKYLISSIYGYLFHDRLSNDGFEILKNIIHVGVGTVIGSFLIVIFNILVGRMLGPEGYGQITLIDSIAMFLCPPMLLGVNTAMVKYNSEKLDFPRQQKIVSTSYILVFILSCLSLIFYILLADIIRSIFSVPPYIYYLSIIFSILYILHSLTTNTLQSLHKMNMLSISKLLYGLVLLSSALIFMHFNSLSVLSIITCLYLSYASVILLTLLSTYKLLRFKFDLKWAKTLFHYGTFSVFSNISYILYTNIDKILINKYMLVSDVGLYTAYYRSSISIIALISGILVTVLFPVMSKYENKSVILQRLNYFMPYLLIFGFLFSLISEYLIINLYGQDYQLKLSLVLLFAITAAIFSCYNLYTWIFNSVGIKGVKLTMLGTGSIAVANILLDIILIPMFGLLGAIGATALAYCIGIFIIIIRFKVNLESLL